MKDIETHFRSCPVAGMQTWVQTRLVNYQTQLEKYSKEVSFQLHCGFEEEKTASSFEEQNLFVTCLVWKTLIQNNCSMGDQLEQEVSLRPPSSSFPSPPPPLSQSSLIIQCDPGLRFSFHASFTHTFVPLGFHSSVFKFTRYLLVNSWLIYINISHGASF